MKTSFIVLEESDLESKYVKICENSVHSFDYILAFVFISI